MVGTMPALPQGLELSVYRIVQEALTNVAKHAGSAPTRVCIQFGGDAVTVDVVNRPLASGPGARPAPRGGTGIRGREPARDHRHARTRRRLRRHPQRRLDCRTAASTCGPTYRSPVPSDHRRGGRRRPGARPRRVPGAGQLRTGPARPRRSGQRPGGGGGRGRHPPGRRAHGCPHAGDGRIGGDTQDHQLARSGNRSGC